MVSPAGGQVGPSRGSHRSPSWPLRLAYTEALADERAITAAAFWHQAVAFFAAHDITPIRPVLTDSAP